MSTSPASLKRFVVATDLSSPSDRAVKRALQLAVRHNAELDIVHIVEEGYPAEAEAEMKAEGEQRLQETLASSPLAGKAKVTIDMVVGLPDPDILERATLFGADCIVLGLHDRILEENRAIEGTLAETVIGSSKKPVLLVKNEPAGPYRNVIVGVDYSPFSKAAIRAAALVASDAAIHLVHAYEGDMDAGPDAKVKELEDFIAETKVQMHGGTVRPDVRAGEPLDVLTDEIEARNADLIVLGTHGRTGLARSLLGSVTTDIINKRLCDVLVICPE